MTALRPDSNALAMAALALLVCFSALHLMALPAFEDEGTQLRLIFRAAQAGEWLQPLGEGKPLEAWPMVPLVWLNLTPLPYIRALHVAAGLLSALLTLRLGQWLMGPRGGLAAAAVFAICPFTVYLERLALADILLCASGAWALLCTARFLEAGSRANAVWLSAAWLLGALCKMPVGFVFLIHVPLALLLLGAEQRPRLDACTLRRVAAAHGPVALLALVVTGVAVWRRAHGQEPGFGLQDLFGLAAGRYPDVAASLGIAHPSLAGELSAQLGWPVLLIALLGLIAAAALGGWRERWLLASGLLPMLAISLATSWFSRYLLFTLPPLIVASARGWQRLGERGPALKRASIGALALALALMAPQSARLIRDPSQARWSALDRIQYIQGWSSGYGYPEAARFLLESASVPRSVFSLDGHGAYQLRTYLPRVWDSRVLPVFYADDGRHLTSPEARLANLIAHAPAWIVTPEPLLAYYLDSALGAAHRGRIDISEVASFGKPQSAVRLGIYEVRDRVRGAAAGPRS